MDEKLLKQLALAKEAGMKGMAKEFFAPAPGSTPAEEQSAPEGGAAMGGMDGMHDAMCAEGGDLSPEQLEELMRMLETQGGGTQ